MTAVARPTRAPLALRSWARSALRNGPERWIHLTAAAGWVALVGLALLGDGHGAVDGSGAMSSDHAMHTMAGMDHMPGTATVHTSSSSWWMQPAMWMAMLSATMLPLLAPNMRYLALHSARRHRNLAPMHAVVGWLGVWSLVALVLATVSWALTELIGEVGSIVVALVVAACWQTTRRKRVVTARCHRTFAPPLTAHALRTCRAYGVRLGADCATSCWALMLAMAVTGHRLYVLVPLAWVSWFERRRSHGVPTTRATVAIIAGATTVAVPVAAFL